MVIEALQYDYNDDDNNNNNNNNNDNNYSNSLYFKKITQSNCKDLPLGPLACTQLAWGPQGYQVVEYIAFRKISMNK